MEWKDVWTGLTQLCENIDECEDCPLYKDIFRPSIVDRNGFLFHCPEYIERYSDAVEKFIEKWIVEHPIPKLTWKQKLEKMTYDEIIEAACPYHLFGGDAPEMDRLTCKHKGDCIACWNEAPEEND